MGVPNTNIYIFFIKFCFDLNRRRREMGGGGEGW